MATTPNDRSDPALEDTSDADLGEAPTEDAEFASLLQKVAHVPSVQTPSMDDSGQLAPGTVLDDKLRIEGLLGRGGMGVVYLADHIQLERRVALKLTHTGGAKATERLLREARAMASVTHENVVTVYDVGTIGEQVFIAMEYLDGGTARSWLRERQRTWREILTLYVAAGRGLAAAHARGLVHRDFKPDNVLIGKEGKVCVADFGLALAPEHTAGIPEPRADGEDIQDGDSTRLTATGSAAGTPAYMPPEQFSEGATANERSDQFAFCVSLYEALCGFRPFPASDLRQMANPSANRLPPETPETVRLPKHVRRALWRGLSADPGARFPSMDALLRELSRDPAAAVRRFALAGVAIGGTAAVTYAVTQREEDPCAGAEQRLVGIWDTPTQTKLADAFAATQISYGDETWEHVSSLLAAYANAWAAAHRLTCEATQKHGSQSAELMDLRMACLDERLDALAATVAILSEPDAEVVRNAFAAAAGLPRLEPCSDTEALREIGAIPEHQAAVAREIRGRLAKASASLRAGRVDEGAELADAALEDAEATGLPVLAAQARSVAAVASQRRRDWDRASELHRSALDAAIVAHDDDTVARSLVNLLYVEGYQLGSADALHWARQADAWLERLGSPPALTARHLANRGVVAREQAHYEDAIGYFERALELYADDQPDAALRARGMLADTYRRMGDLDSAAALFDENLRATETAMGTGHPFFAQELNNSGEVFRLMGRNDEARTRFERALEIRKAALGGDSLSVAESMVNLAVITSAQGDHATAKGHLERAWKVMEGRASPTQQVQVLSNLGAVAFQAGESEQAIEWLEQALELGDRELGSGSPTVIDQRRTLALVLGDAGQLGRAQEVIARALEDLRAAGIDDGIHKQQLLAVRGDISLLENKPAAALEDLRATLELLDKLQLTDFPYRFTPLRGAGEALLELGKPEEAIEYLLQAKDEHRPPYDDDDRARIELALARARLATGDKAAAAESASVARKLLDPADTERIAQADALIAQAK